ncbi:hypothetical protein L208DRAFT_1382707 [Tricholoma matsutake]|nr:hypothetical protein L208DRAFT_1382707 [Tricholoma matsutake 945]
MDTELDDLRLKHSTCGQGGVIAQLTVSYQNATQDQGDSPQGACEQHGTHPEMMWDECPLILTIPKPSLVPTKPDSTFSFKPSSVPSRSPTGVVMSNRKATNASAESSETVPNSEDDSHQAATMDVDLEEFSVDPSNNVDKGSFDDFGNVTGVDSDKGPHEPVVESQQMQYDIPYGLLSMML